MRLLYLGTALATKGNRDIVQEIATSLLQIPVHLSIEIKDQDCEDDQNMDSQSLDSDEDKIDDHSPGNQCTHCSSNFVSEEQLRNHQRSCNDKLISCITLDTNLINTGETDDAFTLYLKPKRKHSKSNLPEQANVNYQEAIKILVCGVCGITTDNFYPLMKKHYETAHFIKEEKTFYCPTESCNKKIASTNSFHSHIHIVHREASYHCDQCSKKFKTSGSLAHHTARWHTSDRPLVCQQCGEGIASALHLEAHMRMHRSRHVCQVCCKKFLSASHLEKHRVTHTSERPFMCGTCGKTFRDPYSVKECEMKHQGIKKLKPSQLIPWRNREAKFVCDTCGYRTKGKAALDRHIKGKHKDCGKDVKLKSNQETHVSILDKETGLKSEKAERDAQESHVKPKNESSKDDQEVQLTDTSRAATAYFWMPHSNMTHSII